MSDISRQIAETAAAELRRRGGRAEVIAKPDGGHKVRFWGDVSETTIYAIACFAAGKHGGSLPERIP